MGNIFEHLRIKTRLQLVFGLIALMYILGLAYNFYHIKTMKSEIDNIYNYRLVGINSLVEANLSAYRANLAISQAINFETNADATLLVQRINIMKESVEKTNKNFQTFYERIDDEIEDYSIQIETYNRSFKIISNLSSQLEMFLNEYDFENSKEIYFNNYLKSFNTLQEALKQLTDISRAKAGKKYESSLEIITKIKTYSLVILFFIILLLMISGYLLTNSLVPSLNEVVSSINRLNSGELPETIEEKSMDKIGEIKVALNLLITGLRKSAFFANQIKQGNLDAEYVPLSEKDMLGNSLLDMRKSLKKAREEEKKRRIEDETQNWTTKGVAKFSDLMQQHNQDISRLSDVLLFNLIQYMDAIQGGLFVINDDNSKEIYLELLASYAYDKRKFLEEKVLFGEGLIGTCAVEQKTTILNDLPENYMKISSGFGDTVPKILVIVPMILEKKIFGVIELASFRIFKDFEIKFIEKIAESLASALSIMKINSQTTKLLTESRGKSKQMLNQEEEMKLQFEEILSIQEEEKKQTEIIKNQFEALFSVNFVIFTDEYGFIKEFSSALLKKFALKNENLNGLTLGTMLRNMSNVRVFENLWEEITTGKSETVKGELVIDKKEFPCNQTLIPIHDEENEIKKVMIVLQFNENLIS